MTMLPSRPTTPDFGESSSSGVSSRGSGSGITPFPPSPARSDTSLSSLGLDTAVEQLNTCTELGGSVASLLRESTDVVAVAPWNAYDEKLAYLLESIVERQVKVLEKVDRAVRIQTLLCERMLHAEGEIAIVRGEVGQGQRAAKRLLYRTTERVRQERQAIRDDSEQLRELSRSLSQNQATHALHIVDLSHSLQHLRDDLENVRRSSWSFKIRGFASASAAFAISMFAFLLTLLKMLVDICIREVRFSAVVLWEHPELGWFLFQTLVLLEDEPRQLTPASIGVRPIWEAARA